MTATSWVRQGRTVLEMIKIEHTLFALPFALIGMLLAAGGLPDAGTVFWIVVAMVGARSAAMAFNRLVDRDFDAANPRTRARALPAGLVTPRWVAGFVVASCALLVLAAWRLNPLALTLSPVALVVLLGYSFTKRFTWASHLVLGLALAGAPLGAWIAVRGSVAPTPFVLAGAVLCWVAGFDVLYALQDREFDRARGLFSVPARFGVVAALAISAALHLAMLVLLALLPGVYAADAAAVGEGAGGIGWGRLGLAYWIGWAGCALLVGYQHWIVRPRDLSRLDAAFFQANGFLALWLLSATAVDLFAF
jgi:4-hydroxybenzoate polyprenyltransferase